MEDAKLPAKVEQKQQEEIINLPDFFQYEFPDLSRFLEEEWLDGDKLNCIKCDRFVESINKEGLCPECEEEKRSKEE